MRSRTLVVVVVLSGLLVVAQTSDACTNQAPVADLVAQPSSVVKGNSVTLDGSDSYDPDGSGGVNGIEKFEWDFDYDGVTFDIDEYETSTHHDGAFDGKTTHVYNTCKTYTAALRVWDGGSPALSDTDTCTVEVIGGGATIYVPSEVSSIQGAIDESCDGDTIIASQGTYYENINFTGKKITVSSTDPNDPDVVNQTIIDGDSNTDTVTFDTSEDANAVITGFKIVNASGYGIKCDGASPTISNCTVSDNSSRGMFLKDGSPSVSSCTVSSNTLGGIYCNNVNAVISDCNIDDNGSWRTGIHSADSSLTITRCRISKHLRGISIDYQSSATIKNCVIFKNTHYGIETSSGASVTITNCTIAYAIYESGTGYGIYGYGATAAIKNCIFWNNEDDMAYCSATYSRTRDVNSGEGNIHLDPLFVDADNNDFHLSSWSNTAGYAVRSSPCIDTGDPCSDHSNEPDYPYGQINMGAYGNTDEAASIEDEDDDGIVDDWERYYWPSDDPNEHDPNDDTDSDNLTNLAEYLFGYDPTQSTQAPEVVAGVSNSQIDPTQGEQVIVSYIVKQNADDVNVSFIRTDSENPVRTITQENITSYELNQVVWDGTDTNNTIVQRFFYDVNITVYSSDSNTYYWTSPDGGSTSCSAGGYLWDSNDFNAYRNIPVIVGCEMTDWCTRKIDIVKDGYEPEDLTGNDYHRIYHLVRDRLLNPGWSTFYWYGRWGTDIIDIDDPNDAGQICQEAFDIFFEVCVNVNKGVLLVYYDEPISGLRLNPYRVVPTFEEVTTISYFLTHDANVSIDIYDPDGNYFGTLVDDELQQAGLREVVWHGTDGDPNDADSRYTSIEGVYRVEVRISDVNEPIEGSITVYK